MKNLLKTLSILIVLLVVNSCNNTEENLDNKSSLIVKTASTKVNSAFNRMKQTRSVLDDFNYSEIFSIEDTQEEKIMYTAINADNPKESIAFNIVDNEVTTPFKTKGYFIDDNHFKSEIYTINDILVYQIIISKDGTISVDLMIDIENSNIGNKSWWSSFDDCFGDFHDITGSNIGNAIFGYFANAFTGGGYTAGVVVICAGVATGEEIQEGMQQP